MNLADIAVHGRKFALEGWGGCVCGGGGVQRELCTSGDCSTN